LTIPFQRRRAPLRVLEAVEALVAICENRVVAMPATKPQSHDDLVAMVLLASRAHLPGRKPASVPVACDVGLARMQCEFDFTNPVGRLLLLGFAAHVLAPHLSPTLSLFVQTGLVREKRPVALHAQLRRATAKRVAQRWTELEERRADIRRRGKSAEAQLAELLPEGFALMDHQLEGVVHLQDRSMRALLADDQGLGKTITALAAVALEGPEAFPLVIVAPASVVGTWAYEASRWLQAYDPCVVTVDKSFQGVDTDLLALEAGLEKLRKKHALKTGRLHVGVRRLQERHPEGARHLMVQVSGGLRWKRRPAPDKPRPLVVVTSWAQMLRKLEDLVDLKPEMVIGDEFHEQMTVHTSPTTKAFWTLRNSTSRRLMLSGTDLPNGRPVQLYAGLKAVDPRGVPDFTQYGKKWCGPKTLKLGQKRVTSYKGRSNRVEFGQLLAKYQVRRIKAELPEGTLPEKIRYGVRVALSDSSWLKLAETRDQVRQKVQARAEEVRIELEALEEASEEEIEEKVKRVLGSETVTALGRLRVQTGLAKIPALLTLVAELREEGERPLVFCEHHDVVDAARAALEKKGLTVFTGTGKSGGAAKRKALTDAWQAGEGDVMLITRAFISGVTLTSGAVGISLERYWVPGHEHQAEDRLHRFTQERDVRIFYLHAPGTPDDAMTELSLWKEEGISELQGSTWRRVLEWLTDDDKVAA
jgi:hypothetical protein